jgi:hypothetical protein
MATLDYDEAVGNAEASFPDMKPTGPRVLKYEESDPGFVPPEKRGILSNTPDESIATWLPKSAGTIATDVVAGIVGAPGEMLNFGNMLGAKAASVIDPSKSFGERTKEWEDYRTNERKKGLGADPSVWLPNFEDVKEPIAGVVGSYEPTTGWGRAVQTGLGAAATALTPGGAPRDLTLGKKLVTEALPAFIGGSTAQAVGENTQDPFLAAVSGMAATVPTRIGTTIARNWSSPEETASRVAGQALREGADDPAKAKAALDAHDPVDYLPGHPVRSSSVSGDQGLAGMDMLLDDQRLRPQHSAANDIANIVSGDPERAKTVVATGASDAASKINPDVQGSYGLTSNTPRQTSSTDARGVFNTLEEHAHGAMEAAWKDPLIAKANLFKNKVIKTIDDYVGGLTSSRRRMIPPDVMDTVEQIRSMPGRDIPLSELQDLRSRVLSAGRQLFRSGDSFAGGENNAFGRKLSEVLNDGANIVFGDKTGAARTAWQRAIDATRTYHQTFNDGFLKDLNTEGPSGALKVATDNTIGEMLKPGRGTQALEQMQQATNGAINGHVADYMVAKLTTDGSKIITPAQVDKWLASGNNQAIVSRIPGLANRIAQIRMTSVADQVANEFKTNANRPDKLVAMFDNNRAAIDASIPPAERPYFTMLENSARKATEKLPTEPSKLRGTLRKLATGNTSDILFALGTKKITSALAGIASLTAAGHFIPQVGEIMEGAGTVAETGLGAVVGLGHLGRLNIGKGIERALTGDVSKRAMTILQKARNDPKLMSLLMSKPTPEVLSHLLAPGATLGVIESGNRGIQDGRQGFATGGSVIDADGEADRLIGETEKARKYLNSKTEKILDKPDHVVVAALNAVKNLI